MDVATFGDANSVVTDAYLEIVRRRMSERLDCQIEGDSWEIVKERLGWEFGRFTGENVSDLEEVH